MQLLATVRKLTADSEASEHQIANAAFAKADTEAQRLHEVRARVFAPPHILAHHFILFPRCRRRSASLPSCKHGASSRR